MSRKNKNKDILKLLRKISAYQEDFLKITERVSFIFKTVWWVLISLCGVVFSLVFDYFKDKF